VRYQRKSSRVASAKSTFGSKTIPVYTIHEAGIDDIEIIRNLALEIWPRTYSEIFAPQQVIYMLNFWFSEASILKQMRDGHRFSIIYASGKPIGFASYSEVRPYIFKLHKIYILPTYQGLGAGTFVMEYIIVVIKQLKASSLLLNVNQHSPAKAFYEHLGFTIARTERTEVGNGFYLNEFVMELLLTNLEAIPEKAKAFPAT